MTEKLKFCVSQKSWGQEYDWPGRGDCSWVQSLHKHWVNGRKKCMICEQKEGPRGEKEGTDGWIQGQAKAFQVLDGWKDGWRDTVGGEMGKFIRE